MTVEEAISRMNEVKGLIDIRAFTVYRNACDMAIEALEKSLAKKPLRIDENESFDGNWYVVCPRCRRILLYRITTTEESYPIPYNTTNHCDCDQKIDWNYETVCDLEKAEDYQRGGHEQ